MVQELSIQALRRQGARSDYSAGTARPCGRDDRGNRVGSRMLLHWRTAKVGTPCSCNRRAESTAALPSISDRVICTEGDAVAGVRLARDSVCAAPAALGTDGPDMAGSRRRLGFGELVLVARRSNCWRAWSVSVVERP